jgi:hypothetical protein
VVRVRVLDKPFLQGAARAVSTFAASALVAILVDDYTHLGIVPIDPAPWGYMVVTALFSISAAAPWLARGARARVADLSFRGRVLRAGKLAIRAEDVTALRVVEAARGYSIAVAHERRITFLELERAADVAFVMSAVGPRPDAVALPRSSRVVRVAQIVLSVLVVIAALLYAAEAFLLWWLPVSKTLPGFLGVAFAQVAFLVTAIASRRDFASTPFGDHVALHASSPHVAHAPAAALSSAPRGWVARGDEPVAAWFARLDAAPAVTSIYRDAEAKDVLWEIVADADAPVDARVGAARVLRRRHREPQADIVRVVEDSDIRVRVEAATDDDDDGCEKIERLGPVFRYPARP